MYQSYHAYTTGSLLSAWRQLEEQLEHSFDTSLPQMIADNYLRHAVKETADAIPVLITSGKEGSSLTLKKKPSCMLPAMLFESLLRSTKRAKI